MEKLPLPEKYEIKRISENQADIIIEPCYPGYGTTIGNTLRRVLLSSLSGVAITAIKIKKATHEFSTLPGVKEDFVSIILNLKLLRFKLHKVNETKVMLKVKGEKKVKAKDIQTTSELEIVNPEADIATLTDKNAELEIELTIQSGRGYLPVENVEKKKIQLGTIAIDAIFTPVKNVNFRVQNVRVGQMTNYDQVILGITTDGTITPEEALKKASQILVEHYTAIIDNLGKTKKEDKKIDKSDELNIKEESEIKKIVDEPDAPKTKKKRGRPRKE